MCALRSLRASSSPAFFSPGGRKSHRKRLAQPRPYAWLSPAVRLAFHPLLSTPPLSEHCVSTRKRPLRSGCPALLKTPVEQTPQRPLDLPGGENRTRTLFFSRTGGLSSQTSTGLASPVHYRAGRPYRCIAYVGLYFPVIYCVTSFFVFCIELVFLFLQAFACIISIFLRSLLFVLLPPSPERTPKGSYPSRACAASEAFFAF